MTKGDFLCRIFLETFVMPFNSHVKSTHGLQVSAIFHPSLYHSLCITLWF